jgi:hypothetical protein
MAWDIMHAKVNATAQLNVDFTSKPCLEKVVPVNGDFIDEFSR